jgi:F-type H+-transporting ATPase subunit b
MRYGWFCKVAAILVLVDATAGAVFAADKKSDIFSLRYDLGLWSLVVFLSLYFILKRVAWGPILQGLQKRESDLHTAIEEAKVAREETRRAKADFEEKLAKAHEEIPRMMDQARREAQALAKEMRGRAQQEIQTERQRLRREIETARDQALQDIWTQAAQVATLISAKAISRSLSADDHRRLVDEAMGEMREAHEKRRDARLP